MAPRRLQPDTTFSRYLDKYGESLHSFELRIDSAPAAAEICHSRSLSLSTVYPKFFFVKPQSTGGVVVQLCGKSLENDPQDYHGWNPDWIEGHPSSLRRLRHILCVVRDIDMARGFFCEVLDGELLADERIELPQPGRQIRVLLGDTKVALISADDPANGSVGDYFSRPASGVFALVWEVENLSVARSHLEGIGLKLVPSLLHAEGFAIDPAEMHGARHEYVRAS
jgi:catechol 2,3-dioxygenase-like lactoylglutathione lyase family enzyme